MMRPESWKLGGGINLVRPAITRYRAPGELVGCMNYESREEGYRRISGYERHDGRPAPSYILDDEPGEEDIRAEIRRAAIKPVPGDELLAVWRYKNRTYAFAKDGTAIRMYGSSTSGWVEMELGFRVAFTVGTGDAPANGEAIANASSVAGTIIGHYLTSGTWAGGDAAGVLVFSYAAADRFATSDSIAVDADSSRTFAISAIPVQQVVASGAADTKYEFRFINHNFFGVGTLDRMYGVSGAGLPFEYDGTMFLQLETGVTTSNPTRIATHEKHLFVGYPEGAVTWSGIGNPRSYTATDGAGELGIGDTLADMIGGYKNTLFVYGRNSTHFLTGTSGANFTLKRLSDEAGAMPGTSVLMSEPTVLDDRGIRDVTATEAFGDFSVATISEPVRPLLDFKRDGGSLPAASTRIRRKSQYRVFFDDGDCLVMGQVRRGGRLNREFTRFSYDLFDKLYDPEEPTADYGRRVGVLTSVCSVEDSDGRERVFFAMKDTMFVYEMDAGKSFDSHPIPYFLRLPFNDFRAPYLVKRYRRLLLEVDSSFESTFAMAADFDDEGQEGERGQLHTVSGPSSFWSEGNWSAAYWDQVPTRHAAQRIHGRGRNVSVLLYSQPTKVEEAHVVSGVTVYWEPRKMQR